MKKIIDWIKSLFHEHTFDIKEVSDLEKDPVCTCGKHLSELIQSERSEGLSIKVLVDEVNK